VEAQPPSKDCSGTSTQFPNPSKGSCMVGWKRGQNYEYPQDFGKILNKVEIYTCKESKKRIIISNGIPDHGVKQGNSNIPCETNWVVSMPLEPKNADSVTEIPIRGAIAMAVNGVPAYGPQEVGGHNAVEPDSNSQIQDAQFWYGHSDMQKQWHFHNPLMGKEEADSDTLLGYAFDGFPIYGPLSESSKLDECNGRTKNGKYMYHVVEPEEVNEDDAYCNGKSPVNRWNYILGCYSGTTVNTQVTDSKTFKLPNDCTMSTTPTPTSSPTRKPTDSETPTPTSSPTRKPTDSDECTQENEDVWLFKMKKKKEKWVPVLKTCEYLEGLSNGKKKKMCDKKVAYKDEYRPPQAVCEKSCKSCGSCYENKYSKFDIKLKNNPQLKTCTWLSKQSEKKKKKQCTKKWVPGVYGTPSAVCPVTCGVGNCAD